MRLEHECYSVGHLYNLKFRMNSGLFRPPVVIRFIFEILGGIEPEVDNHIFIKGTAERLFGTDSLWSVLGAEANRIPLAGTASRMDGNVWVGLEDNLLISHGQLAESNARQGA